MNDVQRVQRLFPQIASSVSSARDTRTGVPDARSHAKRVAEVCRSGSILAADCVAFVASAALGLMSFLLSRQTGLSAAPSYKASAYALLLTMGAGLVAAVLVLAAREHYTYRVGFWTRLQDLCLAALAVFTTAAASAFLFSAPLPRVDLVVTSAVFPLAAMCFRWAARASLEAAGLWQISAVVVGDGAWPGKAAHILQSERELGYAVAACIAPPRPDQVTGASIWQRILRSHQASLLVLAYGAHTHPDPALVASLVRGRVPFALMPEGSHLPMVGARRMALAQDATLICYRNNLQKPLARATKILFDLAAAGAALVILAPVMLIIAVLVKLDGGPVFFAHTRLGAGGRSFRCLKFRSMVTDSEAALNDLFKRDPAAREEWLRTHKLRRDPRVTAIGHVLRMTSLDELPQLLNVLRLEMSLVGPRPIVSQEVPRYGDNIAYYYETRPGVTGLWQVSGRSDTTYAQRVHLDSWYVKNWTLAGDLSILARTIPAVLSGRGAG